MEERLQKIMAKAGLGSRRKCEEYILEGIEDNSSHQIAFRSNIKDLNLNTIADMNKIIKNIEFLADITKDIDE